MDPSSKKRKGEENGGFESSLLTPSDARKIIEPFSREQFLEIVQEAACRHPDVLNAVRTIADQDLAQRKLFIRGLGWETSAEGLRSLFSAYGDLEEAVVIMDKATGKSKGYGFIIFRHVDGALLALKEPSKKIDGRMTVSQLAVSGAAGSSAAQTPAVDVAYRKIYVGNVPYDMPSERLLAHFSTYGEIEEGPLGFDKQTGKSRGFALFVYKTAEGAKASLADPSKVIDGHTMVCKLASDGKRGKPGQPPDSRIGGVHTQPNGLNLVAQPHAPGPMSVQYNVPGSMSSYPGYSGPGIQGPGTLNQHQHQHQHLGSSVTASTGIGAPGISAMGAQGGSLSSGSAVFGNVYPSQFGGLPQGGYGGMSGSSFYRTTPNPVAMPSAFPQNGSSPAQRGQPGGVYPGVPPTYF